MARIHGRVVGSAAALEDLTIEVEDLARTYEPRIDDGGVFEINLPVGSYSIVASSGDQVALAEVKGLAADESREVVLVLAEGVSIAGRVEGCDKACAGVTVYVHVPSTGQQAGVTECDKQGGFAVEGLVPGRNYEITFRAAGKRHLVLRDVAAPRQGLVVILEPAASLSGGFGLVPGQKCPMESVTLGTAGEGDIMDNARFDRACRFRFQDLPDAESVHVSAEGKGWHFEIDVPVPAHGDPPFLCLHPTCREPEPEIKASLEVAVQGNPGHGVYVRAAIPDDERTEVTGCESSTNPCVVENLRPSQGVRVDVHATACESRSYTLDIHPGTNYLTSPCEGIREIQGVIHGGTGRGRPADARVRCSSNHPERPVNGFLFDLRCPERLPTIEYRFGEDGPWRSAPIAPGDADGVSFVEIAPG
jgi:hypothetical protein